MIFSGQDHPLPPKDLNDRVLQIKDIEIGTILFRIYRSIYRDDGAIFFGQSLPHRFDAPKQFGILYAGMTDFVAFLETMRGSVNNGWVDRQNLEEQSISQLIISRPLRLIKASGPALERMGADSGLFSTKHHRITQAWSLAFWQHPQNADGIIYPSCHDNEQFCVALYEDRVKGILSVHRKVELFSPEYRDRLDEITKIYGYRIPDM